MKDYKEMLIDLVDSIAKFDDRAAIFRRNDIPRSHFYNVTNDDRLSSSGKPYHTPLEWVVKLTRDSGNPCMIKKVAKDCGGTYLSPEEKQELKTILEESIPDTSKIWGILQKLAGE
jgi:hypothetical protein